MDKFKKGDWVVRRAEHRLEDWERTGHGNLPVRVIVTDKSLIRVNGDDGWWDDNYFEPAKIGGPFAVGDRVMRVAEEHMGMIVGDQATVVAVLQDPTAVELDVFDGSHDPKNFALVGGSHAVATPDPEPYVWIDWNDRRPTKADLPIMTRTDGKVLALYRQCLPTSNSGFKDFEWVTLPMPAEREKNVTVTVELTFDEAKALADGFLTPFGKVQKACEAAVS